jgi:hypothetical protein
MSNSVQTKRKLAECSQDNFIAANDLTVGASSRSFTHFLCPMLKRTISSQPGHYY